MRIPLLLVYGHKESKNTLVAVGTCRSMGLLLGLLQVCALFGDQGLQTCRTQGCKNGKAKIPKLMIGSGSLLFSSLGSQTHAYSN